MKQTQSVKLLAYWEEIYSENGIPERSQIEPSSIRSILGDTFILEFEGEHEIKYRLAGTRLCAIFGEELKGAEFGNPWQINGEEAVSDIARAAARDSSVAVFGSNATSKSGRKINLETLILPLLHNGKKQRRMLGVTSPVSRPFWLGMDPVVKLELSSLRIIQPNRGDKPLNSRFSVFKNSRPIPVSTSTNSRKVRHLTVLEGGLAESNEGAQV